MDAKTILDLFRAGLTALAAVRSWTQTASAEQLKAFVAGVHAEGDQVDMTTVDGVVADLDATIAAVQARIDAAGG